MESIMLKNSKIEVVINLFGAEIKSIINKETNQEYMWQADPKFWGRTAPILFPLVGSLNNKEYTYNGVKYQMNQHGFARDSKFELEQTNGTEAWFLLENSDESYKIYPFKFRLYVGYKIDDYTINVMWKVINSDNKEIYFSIGAHPGFACPLNKDDKQTDCTLLFRDKNGNIVNSIINRRLQSQGLVLDEKERISIFEGCLPITEKLFDNDALIIENHQVHSVSLLDRNNVPYVTLEFDAPLVGVWSPPKKNAPFVCIEPWYGRCDSETYDDELRYREWGNTLDIAQVFEVEYKITIG